MVWLPLALLLAPGPGVSWEAPPACPGAASIDARLESANVRLARPVVARVASPSPSSSTWRLDVRVADLPVRRLEGENCDALADALVAMLIIQAMAEVPSAQAAKPGLPPPALPGPPALPTASETAMPTPTPTPTPPVAELHSPMVVLGITAGVHGVGVPGPGGGIGADAGVRYPHLRLVAYGRWWFRRDKAVTGPVEATYRLVIGGVEACGVARFGRIDALGCALGELGELRARGVSAAPSRTKRHLWLAPGGRLGAQWRTRSTIRFGLSAVALVPLNRREFRIGEASAGQVGPVELRGLAHVVFAIPAQLARNRDER